jgi:hypothetical protein
VREAGGDSAQGGAANVLTALQSKVLQLKPLPNKRLLKANHFIILIFCDEAIGRQLS